MQNLMFCSYSVTRHCTLAGFPAIFFIFTIIVLLNCKIISTKHVLSHLKLSSDQLRLDNAQSHVTAFRPISEAARSWSDDNSHLTAFRAVSEAARSWSDDNSHVTAFRAISEAARSWSDDKEIGRPLVEHVTLGLRPRVTCSTSGRHISLSSDQLRAVSLIGRNAVT